MNPSNYDLITEINFSHERFKHPRGSPYGIMNSAPQGMIKEDAELYSRNKMCRKLIKMGISKSEAMKRTGLIYYDD